LIKSVLATWLAVFWTVAAGYCQIEVLPGMEFLRCVPAQESTPASGSHCGDSVCANIESGQYRSESARIFTPAPLLTLAVCALAFVEAPLSDQEAKLALIIAEATAPPKPWQFTHRTALAPRAPSIAS
jgi:hypothetical protein